MKELHLICNAHLDPVWQWDWNEGTTAALATFYSAAELAEEYDYIFCHNEAYLYEKIEELDPALFARIQGLVKVGKWHIMGGWYVQPDCNAPGGEAFIRQIETGLKYFKEKFDYRPTVAVNFDSFGHTQGLVQILKKCGYNGYIFCRPMKECVELPSMHFNWIGFDGSSVTGVRSEDDSIYCSALGNAVSDIKRKMIPWSNEKVGLALWGVGNHGGGPSRKDLTEIKQWQEEMKKEGVQIYHSTPEQLINALQPKADFNHALQPILVKCYSSDSRIKQKHAELENKLLFTEKICVVAQKELGVEYPYALFEEAQKCMAAIQFHDILSGTSIRVGEESSLRKADYALELLDKAFTKAFMALMGEYERVTPDTYPLFAYNPHPYEYEGEIEGEILMLDAIGTGTDGYEFEVTKDGKVVEYQILKEDSNINFDRRKRLAINAKLAPMSVTKFDVAYRKGQRYCFDRTPKFIYDNGVLQLKFNPDNGCIQSCASRGKEYLAGDAFLPIMFDDNEDPWGWNMKTVGWNYQKMEAKIVGRVVENGTLYTKLENVYTLGKSEVCVWYKVYANRPYVDIQVRVVWNEDGKGFKIGIPFANSGEFIGQTSFGIQSYEKDMEQCAQKFCGIDDGEKVFALAANYIGGCSVEENTMYITLLNGSVYCAHPVGDLPIVDDKRCNDYIEKGRHSFEFRLFVGHRALLEKTANELTQKVYVLNAYPHGNGRTERGSLIKLANTNVTLSSLRMVSEGVYMIRLLNNFGEPIECSCKIFDKEAILSFGAYEAKTLIYKDEELKEQNSMLFL